MIKLLMVALLALVWVGCNKADETTIDSSTTSTNQMSTNAPVR